MNLLTQTLLFGLLSAYGAFLVSCQAPGTAPSTTPVEKMDQQTSTPKAIKAEPTAHSYHKGAPPVEIDSSQDPHLITESQPLTTQGKRAGEGYFSADGKRMIFQSERSVNNPFFQMYVMNLKSKKIHRVSTGKGKTTCGWIHPKEKRLLFSSTHSDKKSLAKQKLEIKKRQENLPKKRYSWDYDDNYEIWETNLKGKRLKRLTTAKGYDAEASYSPNGKWIAFASNRHAYTEVLSPEDQKRFKENPSYLMEIYLMHSKGGHIKRLTKSKGYDGGPFFSPDGKRIVWRRFSVDGRQAEIFTMNIDGSDQKQITQLKVMSWAPFYHPSSDYIIFTSSLQGHHNFELYMVRTDGSGTPVRVTYEKGFDGLPVFTPDGQRLSWTKKGRSGSSQIHIAQWNDTLARELLELSPSSSSSSPQPNLKKELGSTEPEKAQNKEKSTTL